MESLLQKGNKALQLIMDTQLEKTPYLVDSDFTIADISLCAYTHVADQGGYDLSLFPNLQSWIERIQAMPDYCDMDILDLESI
jgi:glutathione S-transferase